MSANNTSKMIEILRKLKPEMHGQAVEDMERRGLRYGLNYGVAIPVIRRVAKEYAPDHELALHLFRQDIREMKLMAVYVDDPAQVSAGQVEDWTSAMPSGEVMEHAAMNLFHAAPCAAEIIPAWMADGEVMKRKGALYMAGRRALSELDKEPVLRAYIRRAREVLPQCLPIPEQAAVYFFCRLAQNSPELHRQVREVLEEWANHKSQSVRELAGEIDAFLQTDGPDKEVK